MFYRQTRFGENLTEGARTEALVFRHDDAGVRVAASEDNVTPSLAAHHKSCPEKHLYQLLAGYIRRQLQWGLLVTSSKYSLPASVGTGSPAAMQSSMYRSAASRMFLVASSQVSP